MISVSFHRLAAKEFREVRAWYTERDSAGAVRFEEAVHDAVERIRADPQSHPSEWKQFRWVRVRRFPLRLIFEQPDADRVLIIAVAHTSRHPQYWQGRE